MLDPLRNPLRGKVLYLYKELLYMGLEYPKGYDYFKTRLSRAFKANKHMPNDQVQKALDAGEYFKKELIALYKLRTYRAVKRNYYD